MQHRTPDKGRSHSLNAEVWSLYRGKPGSGPPPCLLCRINGGVRADNGWAQPGVWCIRSRGRLRRGLCSFCVRRLCPADGLWPDFSEELFHQPVSVAWRDVAPAAGLQSAPRGPAAGEWVGGWFASMGRGGFVWLGYAACASCGAGGVGGGSRLWWVAGSTDGSEGSRGGWVWPAAGEWVGGWLLLSGPGCGVAG